MSSSKEQEVLSLKKLIYEAEGMIKFLADQKLSLEVRLSKIEETLSALWKHLKKAEKELEDEMQSVQAEHGDERQLHGSGENALSSEVLRSHEE